MPARNFFDNIGLILSLAVAVSNSPSPPLLPRPLLTSLVLPQGEGDGRDVLTTQYKSYFETPFFDVITASGRIKTLCPLFSPPPPPLSKQVLIGLPHSLFSRQIKLSISCLFKGSTLMSTCATSDANETINFTQLLDFRTPH